MFQYLRFWRLCPAARELVRFQLFFCPQSLEIYLKMHFKTFKTSPLSLSVVKRGLSGNFVILSFQITTSVLLYRSRFIIQSSRFFLYIQKSLKTYSPVQKIWLANSKERQYQRCLGEFLYKETKLQSKLHKVAASSNCYRTASCKRKIFHTKLSVRFHPYRL